jgi:ribosomal protein S25
MATKAEKKAAAAAAAAEKKAKAGAAAAAKDESAHVVEFVKAQIKNGMNEAEAESLARFIYCR